MKQILTLTILSLLAVVLMPLVTADCITPTGEDSLINGSITICPGTFRINDTNTNGLFNFSNNSTLDCNGSTFIGNYVGYFTSINGKNNITITNCNIQNYGRGVFITNGNNNTFSNSQFATTIGSNMYGVYINGGSANSVTNNTFVVKTGVYIIAGDNTSITNNIMNNCTYGVRINSGAQSIVNNNISIISSNGAGILDYTGESTATNNVIIGRVVTEEPMPGTGNAGIFDSAVISNNTVQGFGYGISSYGMNVTITNNRVSNSYFGLQFAAPGVIRDNILVNNTQDIDSVATYFDSDYPCPTIENNTITTGDLIYSSSTTTITGKTGTIILCNANNSIVTGNNANIIIIVSDNVTISSNTVRNANYGIHITSSTNTAIINNTIEHNKYGIYPHQYAVGVIASENQINDNSLAGIALVDSSNIVLSNNNISNSKYCIASRISWETTTGNGNTGEGNININISNNKITNCSYAGIYLIQGNAAASDNSNILNNTIWNSTYGVRLEPDNSIWKVDGNTLHNNYWNAYISTRTMFNFSNNHLSNGMYGLYGNYVSSYGGEWFLNNIFENNTWGAYIYGGPLRIFANNTIQNNTIGIQIADITKMNFTNNVIHENVQDVYMSASSKTYCANLFASNTVTSGEITYSNITINITGQNGTIILCGADNSSITYSTGNIISILSNNLLFANNTAHNQQYGMYLGGNNITVANNTITNNTINGIYLYGANNTVTGNHITNNSVGAYLGSTPIRIYNNFFNNTNNTGLAYYYNPYPTIAYYTLTWNSTLINDTNVTINPRTNIFGGSIIGGNFWATPNGTGCSELLNDTNFDTLADEGVCVLGGANNTDYLPLTLKTRPIEESAPEPAVETTTHNSGGPSGIAAGSLMPSNTLVPTPTETASSEPLSSTTEKIFVVNTWNPVRFTISSAGGSRQQHAIRTTRVDKDGAQFIIQSEPINVYLKLNETKQIDLDNDSVNDIAITLTAIKGASTTIAIKQLERQKGIDQPGAETNSTNTIITKQEELTQQHTSTTAIEQTTEQNRTLSTPQETTPQAEPREQSTVFAPIIVATAVLLGIITLVTINRRKKRI